jgi:hypothetical protein
MEIWCFSQAAKLAFWTWTRFSQLLSLLAERLLIVAGSVSCAQLLVTIGKKNEELMKMKICFKESYTN